MFRKMRRDPRQNLSREESMEILQNATSGVLSVLGDDDYPYGVPMSYSVVDNTIYFHCAKKGHKIDALKRHNKVSFTVIQTDQVVPEEYTTYFRSVIAFGRVRFVDDPEIQRKILMFLVDKYSADFKEGSHAEIEGSLPAVQILALDIEHISGKEAIEFAKMR